MVKAIIITEDSRTQIPELTKRRGARRDGSWIEKNAMIVTLLKNAEYPLPGNNSQFEDVYREILSDFIRPAGLMFAGSFLEVRRFSERLDHVIPTELFIISGRYGLISASTTILPYTASVRPETDIESLNGPSNILDKIVSLSTGADIMIFSLASAVMHRLITKGLLEKVAPEKTVIVIGGSKLSQGRQLPPSIVFLPRKGVTRIGLGNQEIILGLATNLAGL